MWRIYFIARKKIQNNISFDFKFSTYCVDQSSYHHEICYVGKTLKARGLQPGMQLIKVNSIDCASRNQKNLVYEIQALNFIQIETKFDKDKFEIDFKQQLFLKIHIILSNFLSQSWSRIGFLPFSNYFDRNRRWHWTQVKVSIRSSKFHLNFDEIK